MTTGRNFIYSYFPAFFFRFAQNAFIWFAMFFCVQRPASFLGVKF